VAEADDSSLFTPVSTATVWMYSRATRFRWRSGCRYASTVGYVGNPLEEARALEGVGRCRLRHGDTGQAIRQLQAALKIYQQIGAPGGQQVKPHLDR
jgi:hypothetical protein